MSAVVAVLEPQPVPVDGRLEVAFVDDVHDEFGALADAQHRAGDRAVVGDHANGVFAEPLRDRRDPQIERVAVGELDDLGRRRLGQARSLGRELSGSLRLVVVVMLVMLHRQVLLPSRPLPVGRDVVRLRCGLAAVAELLSDERGVVSDEAEQRRAAGVLPGEAEEVEPGTSLTPRRWRRRPSSPLIGSSIQEWSGR